MVKEFEEGKRSPHRIMGGVRIVVIGSVIFWVLVVLIVSMWP